MAASYGDAELRIAPWLKRYPDRFFLATKTGQTPRRRGARGAAALARPVAGRPCRPVAAAQPVRSDRVGHRAQPGRRDRGGHRGARAGPGAGHRRHRARRADRGHPSAQPAALRLRLGAAAIQLHHGPVELLRAKFRCAAGHLPASATPRCRPSSRSPTGPGSGRPRSATTWYQPLEDQSDIDTAVHWALGREGIFVISSGDVNLLPKILDAAERLRRAPIRRRHAAHGRAAADGAALCVT